MKITLFNISKTNEKFIKDGIADYQKRIGFFVDFSMVDIPEIKQAKNLSPELIKQKEGEMILKHLVKYDFIAILDENGTQYSSRGLSDWMQKVMNQGTRQLAFVTGGAFGFSDEVYKIAHAKISLSKMTFTHQMVRLIFAEQLYRAFTILKGIPYHND